MATAAVLNPVLHSSIRGKFALKQGYTYLVNYFNAPDRSLLAEQVSTLSPLESRFQPFDNKGMEFKNDVVGWLFSARLFINCPPASRIKQPFLTQRQLNKKMALINVGEKLCLKVMADATVNGYILTEERRKASDADKRGREKYITFLATDQDGEKALMLARSLAREGCKRQLVALVLPAVSFEKRQALILSGCRVKPVDTSKGNSRSVDPWSTDSAFLSILDLAEFSRCLYLHPNTIILKNIDWVFDLSRDNVHSMKSSEGEFTYNCFLYTPAEQCSDQLRTMIDQFPFVEELLTKFLGRFTVALPASFVDLHPGFSSLPPEIHDISLVVMRAPWTAPACRALHEASVLDGMIKSSMKSEHQIELLALYHAIVSRWTEIEDAPSVASPHEEAIASSGTGAAPQALELVAAPQEDIAPSGTSAAPRTERSTSCCGHGGSWFSRRKRRCSASRVVRGAA